MRFLASQFQHQLENKAYVAEASDLRIGQPPWNISVGLNDSVAFPFTLTHVDYDASGEDIAGWNYKPTMEAVSRNSALAGYKVLIIND